MPREFLLLSNTKMGVDASGGLMNFYSPVFGTRVSFNDREVIQKGKKEKIGNCETPLVSTPSTTVIDSLDAFERRKVRFPSRWKKSKA